MTSGTQGNQVSLMAHTQRGDEIILDENCHIFNYEVAALAVLSAVQARTLRGTPRHPGPRRRPGRHPPAEHPLSRGTRSSVWRAPTTAAADRSTRSRRCERSGGSRQNADWRSTWTGPDSSTRAWRWASRRRTSPRRRIP
ncbi:MAG: threonine aldolase family protein [Desulfobacterales bacterium]|nr:threonine aldolase family protein [Desulfobacterales bacterium]